MRQSLADIRRIEIFVGFPTVLFAMLFAARQSAPACAAKLAAVLISA
jgi:hypothetical protein